jgi:DNA repair protein RecO (recombination protein O)
MEAKRERAIVLRTVAYQDRHRIVTALTESHGQVAAMAKNAVQSRRFGGALELFAASEWIYSEKPGAELWQLQEAHAKRSYEGIRRDFERLSLGSVFNELMLKVAPQHEAAPELFLLHANALAYLEEAPGEGAPLPLLNGYLTKILQWSGSQPQLHECLECRTSLESVDPEQPLSCLIADAGWICSTCRALETRHVRERPQTQSFGHSLLRLSPAAVWDFHAGLILPIRQIPEAARASHGEHQALFQFLEALFSYHLPGFDREQLKGLRFLDVKSSPPMQEANPR